MTLRTILAASVFLSTPVIASADTGNGETENEGADEIDSVDLLWLSGGLSYQYLDLRTVDLDGEELTADLIPTQAGGPATDFGIGMRLWVVSLALRMGVGFFEDNAPNRTVDRFQLWTIDLEASFRIPLGWFQPYLLIGGGYATVGGMDDALEGLAGGIDIDGANLRTGLGVDFFLTPILTLGIRGTVDGYFLSRPGVPIQNLAEPREVDTISQARERILEADQTAFGFGGQLGGTVGLHFF